MLKINNKFIVVAFATLNTPYEDVLKTYLLPSLEKLNLPYNIEMIENEGSWLRNVALKPKVILSALKKYPNHQVVCLDADSELLTRPSLFDTISLEYDFGCHFLNWNTWYGYKQNPPTVEVLSGTVWANNTSAAKKILRAWSKKAETSNIWEQKVLSEVLKSDTFANIYKLPIEYCYISSLPNGNPPIYKCSPVVVHHQVSRKLKRKIK